MSNTSAAATGASWLPSTPESFTLGRAKANASSAIAATRSSNSSRCRSRSRRWFVSCRFWTNRSAGNSNCRGLRRMIRCSTIGTAISSSSGQTVSSGLTKGHAVNYPRAVRLTKYSVSALSNCMLVSSGT